MKRKTLTLVLCLLATLALGSIGFATWIIANPNLQVTGTQTGSFTVYDATDQSITVEVVFPKDEDGNEINNLIFGTPTDEQMSAFDHPWVTVDEDMLEENLSVSFDVTAENASFAEGGHLEVYLYVDAASYEIIKKAKESGLINYNDNMFKELTVDDTTVYGVMKELHESVSMSLVFSWGSTFGNKNPFLYYNSLPYTEEAAANLNALVPLNGLNFNILIQEAPAAAEQGE